MANPIISQTPNVRQTPLLLTKDSFVEDIEIIETERDALFQLAQSILDNKYLAWMIVEGWLTKHNCLIVPDPHDPTMIQSQL